MSLSSFGLGYYSPGLKTKINSSQGHKINAWRNCTSNRGLSKDEIFVALWPDWCWAMLIPHYNTELSKQGKEKLLFLVELWYKKFFLQGLKQECLWHDSCLCLITNCLCDSIFLSLLLETCVSHFQCKLHAQCFMALKCVIYSLPLQYLHAGFSYYFRLSGCAKYLLWGISKYFPKCSRKHITTANRLFTGRLFCLSLRQKGGEGIMVFHMHQRYRDVSRAI